MRLAALLALLLLAPGCAPLPGAERCDAGFEAPAVAGMTAAAPTDRVSVLTWNVHALPWDGSTTQRLHNIAREIAARRPDIVLLQELWLQRDAERVACGLRAHYEPVPEAAGVARMLGYRRGGLMALVRRGSAWRIERARDAHFVEYADSAPWYRLDELDGIAGKGIQRFALTDGTRKLLVLNTHLQTQYPARGNRYERERLAQIAQLARLARESGPADTVLAAGDFNVLADEPALYGALTAQLDDLTADYRRACAGCGTFVTREGMEGWWLDYVFTLRSGAAKPQARVERIRNRARDEPYSDHHGVWVELELR